MEHDNETIDPEGFLLVNQYWWPGLGPGLDFTGKVKFSSGNKYWYKNSQLHREDGPAVEYADGSVTWYYDGIAGLENFPPELKKKLARRFLHGA